MQANLATDTAEPLLLPEARADEVHHLADEKLAAVSARRSRTTVAVRLLAIALAATGFLFCLEQLPAVAEPWTPRDILFGASSRGGKEEEDAPPPLVSVMVLTVYQRPEYLQLALELRFLQEHSHHVLHLHEVKGQARHSLPRLAIDQQHRAHLLLHRQPRLHFALHE